MVSIVLLVLDTLKDVSDECIVVFICSALITETTDNF